MGERAKYAIVLWASDPGTVSVVLTENIGYDLDYLEKKDFSTSGTPWRSKGRPKKIKKTSDFEKSLLSAAGLSDDDDEVTSRARTYPVIEDSESGVEDRLHRKKRGPLRKKREDIGKRPSDSHTTKSSGVSPTRKTHVTQTPLTTRKRQARAQYVGETTKADDADAEESDEDESEKEGSGKLNDNEKAEKSGHNDLTETSASSTPIHENTDEYDDIEDTPQLRDSRRRQGLKSPVPRKTTAPSRPTKDADATKKSGGVKDHGESPTSVPQMKTTASTPIPENTEDDEDDDVEDTPQLRDSRRRQGLKSPVSRKTTAPSQHTKDAGAVRIDRDVQAHDESTKLKRPERISRIYTLSDGETEDENEIPKTAKSKRKLLNDEKEYNLLPPARRRGHEIEIYPNTEVFVKKRLLRHALQYSGNRPGDFVCLLMRFLLGEKLKDMTVQGGKNKEAIPKSVYNAVRWAVNSLVQRDDRMDEKEYKRIVTQLCTRSRSKNIKEKKTDEQNNGSERAGVDEEPTTGIRQRTNKNPEPSKAAQKSTLNTEGDSNSDQYTIPSEPV
ncbi:uncharacterized protein LOC107042115 [Diachasma alloeum]|uniref:uncharacterized protein LOC107042115 n=1 Tax=Diachasma alloeum TaxID=454923 RepID=UPI0007384812|nr:uncharacterized protein LOC107042115 [Diachasma alloeum]